MEFIDFKITKVLTALSNNKKKKTVLNKSLHLHLFFQLLISFHVKAYYSLKPHSNENCIFDIFLWTLLLLFFDDSLFKLLSPF